MPEWPWARQQTYLRLRPLSGGRQDCWAGGYFGGMEIAQELGLRGRYLLATLRRYLKESAKCRRLVLSVPRQRERKDLKPIMLLAGGEQLTAEQQVFAECAVETGLQPYAFAACATGQLTLNEFQKCFEIGVGGEGCFGNNNEVVKLVRDFWNGVAGGPNSVLNRPNQIFGGPNSIFNDPAQIWGGPNSVFNNPGQVWGGPNSVLRNPGQIWGGPNSVVRNPDQLLGGPNSFFHKNLGIHF